jgi:glucose-1-phosphate adenylyltransferase
VTIASIPVLVSEAPHFGILETDAKNQVKKFKEKPKGKVKEMPGNPGFVQASMGIYVWTSRALVAALEHCRHSNRPEDDFGKHVIPEALASDMRVYAHPFVDGKNKPRYWADVGRFETYHAVHMDFMGLDPGFNFYNKEWPIHTAARNLPSAKIALSADIKNGSMISDGCVIDQAIIDRSCLGSNVRVGKNVKITNSIIFDNTTICDNVIIENAIIDKHNVIKEGAVLTPHLVSGFDLDRNSGVKEGILVIEKRIIPWFGWVDPEITIPAK